MGALDGTCQSYTAPPAYSRNPRRGLNLQLGAFGSDLVSLVLCLGDALDVIGIKKDIHLNFPFHCLLLQYQGNYQVPFLGLICSISSRYRHKRFKLQNGWGFFLRIIKPALFTSEELCDHSAFYFNL